MKFQREKPSFYCFDAVRGNLEKADFKMKKVPISDDQVSTSDGLLRGRHFLKILRLPGCRGRRGRVRMLRVLLRLWPCPADLINTMASVTGV